MQYSEKVNPNIRGLLLAMLVFGSLLVYGLPALNSRNPLWFIPSLGAEPNQIVAYKDGQTTVYRPGSPGYKALAPLCTKALLEVSGLDDSGLSLDTLKDIRSHGRAIEIYFPQSVTIPTSFPVGKPNQIFVPFDDKYANWKVLFTGNDGTYWAQGLRISSTYDDLRTAFDNLPPTKN
ncbi:MAG: hypothetical protein ACYC3S_05425 [Chloroflexota bacterium]